MADLSMQYVVYVCIKLSISALNIAFINTEISIVKCLDLENEVPQLLMTVG